MEVNPQPPLGDGPLNGIPFGVKDIFETRGLATEYGSHLYKGRRGDCDASLVTRLRELGAILFGKTQTTAFAYFDPSPARNPHDPAHTPGGSSSGSAAAVAAGVVPFALGSQTMGSIVRPASFCGVVGFKPPFGALPTDGMAPFAPSLDTAGFLAANVQVCMDVWRALGFSIDAYDTVRFAVPDNLPTVTEEMQSAFESAIRRIERTYQLDRVSLPVPYDELLSAARLVNDYEGARSQYERWRQHGDGIGAKLADLVQRGLKIPEADYRDSLGLLKNTSVFNDATILLTPSALGAAPQGLASTGDPIMNAVWTALGVPVIGLPMPHPGRLPLGLQMIAPHDGVGMLLSAASQVERLLATTV